MLRTNRRRRRKSPVVKTYFAIFVRMATRTVHIKLTTDLSTAEFLNVLKRFIGRRRTPSHIYSDNIRNFSGSSRELNEIKRLFNSENLQHEVHSFVASKIIEWYFIPPHAPEFGDDL